MVRVTYDGYNKGFVKLWVERLLDNFRLVNLFAICLEYKVRITCTRTICRWQVLSANQVDSQVAHVCDMHKKETVLV